MNATLIPHPTTADGPIHSLTVLAERQGDRLWLRFVAEGDVDRIAWSAETQAGRVDELWRHTCFEVFVRAGEGYREYNLSPSGAWASYAFDGYRSGMVAADEAATVAGLDGASDMVALEGAIELPVHAEALALSAVIEDIEGNISYWALAHPSDKPDFHHPDSFVLELP